MASESVLKGGYANTGGRIQTECCTGMGLPLVFITHCKRNLQTKAKDAKFSYLDSSRGYFVQKQINKKEQIFSICLAKQRYRLNSVFQNIVIRATGWSRSSEFQIIKAFQNRIESNNGDSLNHSMASGTRSSKTHSQGFSNNPFPEPNQPNSSY